MKRAVLLAGLILAPLARLSAEENKAVAPSINVLETLDYQQKFKNSGPRPFVVEVADADFGNSYITAISVAIGTSTFYVDDPKKPTAAVMETSFLGNEVVLRAALVYAPWGWEAVEMQILVKEKWVNCQPNQLRILVLDVKKLLKKGRMKGVMLLAPPLGDGPPVELKIQEKN